MKQIVIVDREDIYDVEIEMRNAFVRECIEAIGIPGFSDVWPEDIVEISSIEDKIRLRSFLNKHDIIIDDDKDGNVKIYVGKNIIAEWKKCRFDLRTDPSQIDPSKRIYARIHVDCWSVFDEVDDSEYDIDNG